MKITKKASKLLKLSSFSGLITSLFVLSAGCESSQIFEEQISRIDDISEKIERIIESQEKTYKLEHTKFKNSLESQENLVNSLKTVVKKLQDSENKLLQELEQVNIDAEKLKLEVQELEQKKESVDSFEEIDQTLKLIREIQDNQEEFNLWIHLLAEAKDLYQTEKDISVIAAELEDTRISSLSSYIKEFALYLLGFKWIWGIFIGYRGTFVGGTNTYLQQLYSALTGKNISRLTIPFNLLSYKENLTKVSLKLQNNVRKIQDFSRLQNLEINQINQEIKHFGYSIFDQIDQLEETKYLEIDRIRTVVESISTLLYQSIEPSWEELEYYEKQEMKSITKEVGALLQKLVYKIKVADILKRISKLTFKNASSYPLNFLTTKFGMQEPSSFQENTLQQFRAWKQANQEKYELVEQEVKEIRQQLMEIMENLEGEIKEEFLVQESSLLPQEMLKNLIFKANATIEQFEKNSEFDLLKFVTNKLEAKLKQMVEPVILNLKSYLSTLVVEKQQSLALQLKIQEKNKELKEKQNTISSLQEQLQDINRKINTQQTKLDLEEANLETQRKNDEIT